MKHTIYVFILTLFLGGLYPTGASAQDWPNLKKFRADNEKLEAASLDSSRVVFMGNSITEYWKVKHPDFFTGHYVNRGISGQTTPQMLIRFRPDVIKLHPDIVVILAGTNDIAGNTGPSTPDMIMDNIISMSQLAKANGIKVILCSVLPAFDYPWRKGLEPAEKILKLNNMIKKYAKANHIFYLDYYSSLVDERKGMNPEYTRDGVHPNSKGYDVMEPLVNKAIKKVLSKKLR
ncbi:MAG: SGNH/GDSL hydrolase family protein [Bacteroidales bacterium]|jgi:lysophospholipase L1-like esterase|nr:SGNH/GDSL hydrolase family protein [Bacteroidales bacterium]